MLEIFGLPLGTPLQGGIFLSMLGIFGLALRTWVHGMPDRKRADNEGAVINNSEAALRFKEFRLEVHALRNEVQGLRGELHKTMNQSERRGTKLDMLFFILRMVIGELEAKDPRNKVLHQAKGMLSRIEDEGEVGESDVLSAARETVREVKKMEADDDAGEE